MRGIGSWLALSFRLHRWEVVASVAGTTIWAAASLWSAWTLRGMAAGEPGCPDPAAFVPGCEAFVQRFSDLSGWAGQLVNLAWGAPFVMGLLLGVPLVSRELESGTAQVAWTLSRSRIRWLAGRAAFLALVLVTLLAVVAVVSEVLASALLPMAHLDRDFTWYGRRGILVVARGLASLGLGLVIGTLVGRLLPAILAAAFASVLVFVGLSLAMDRLNESDAVAQPYGLDRSGALFVAQRVELPSGELIDYAELMRRGVTYSASDENGAMYADVYDLGDPDKIIGWDRELVIPGRRYPELVLRESLIVTGAAALLAGLAGLAVVRRRPA